MRIVAYCRVSTDKDEQLNSLENQKSFFLNYAQKNGHTLINIYADEGISGTSLKRRTEFQRLLNDAKLGGFDMVVVKDISRFARNTVDFLQSIRSLKNLGINTLFLTANMTSLGESEFILAIFGALAQEESINLSKRIKFGKKINSEKGSVPQIIFGYDRIDQFTLMINYREANIVREIYRMYLNDGFGYRKISLELNKLGHKTKLGCEWTSVAVRRILTNPIYSGEYVNNKYEIVDCLEGKMIRKNEEDHIHHVRKEWAIISQETFKNVQNQLKERRKKYLSQNTEKQGYASKHIFSTLIKCENCTRSFTRKKNNNAKFTRIYWKCPTNDQNTSKKCPNNISINEEVLIEQLREYFNNVIIDRDNFIAEIVSEVKSYTTTLSEKLSVEDIKRKQKILIAKRDRYLEMYAADLILLSELKQKEKNIERELELLENLKTSNNSCCENDENKYFTQIELLLNFRDFNNADMRKIIEHISVSSGGSVKIYIKKFDKDIDMRKPI